MTFKGNTGMVLSTPAKQLRKDLPMADTFKPTVKRAIDPVKVTITVVCKRVNENGTLSGLEDITASAKGVQVAAKSSNQSGGAIWLSVDSLKGLRVHKASAKASNGPKAKLF